MSGELPRDTQFAGFAKLERKEISRLFSNYPQYDNLDAWFDAVELLLAQCAYDFACHIWNETIGGGNAQDVIRGLPDMTAWPEEGSE